MVSSRLTANTEQPTIFIELTKKTNENGQKLSILFFVKKKECIDARTRDSGLKLQFLIRAVKIPGLKSGCLI